MQEEGHETVLVEYGKLILQMIAPQRVLRRAIISTWDCFWAQSLQMGEDLERQEGKGKGGVAMPSSRDPPYISWHLLHCRQILYHSATRKAYLTTGANIYWVFLQVISFSLCNRSGKLVLRSPFSQHRDLPACLESCEEIEGRMWTWAQLSGSGTSYLPC